MAGPGSPLGPPMAVADRRLTSSDSFKQAAQMSRGGPDGRPSKDLAWASQDGSHSAGGDGQSQPSSSVGPDGAISEQGRSSNAGPTVPFPSYDGEYYPASTHDDQPGVLKGTSADYYSPDIPSEAFGMVINEEADSPTDIVNRPDRSLSRGSSLRYVKHMFHRKSVRDRTRSSRASSEGQSPISGAPRTRGLGPMEHIITDRDPTASPTDLSPTTTNMPRPAFRASDPPIIQVPSRSSPENSFQTPPPHSPPLFKGSPSPPTQPAAGTVNPMDIMPAMTESEKSHRIDHQLYVSAYGPSPGRLSSSEPPELEFTPGMSSPSPTSEKPPCPTHIIQSPTPTTTNPALKQEPEDDEDVAMRDIPSHNTHLSPMPMLGQSRHPSYPSEPSTPLPGLASTVPSSQNTPSTQLDSTSPQSWDSSDFRHSASPQVGLGVPSLKNGVHGVHRCEEPGCSQTFDQPHKLKYVLHICSAITF